MNNTIFQYPGGISSYYLNELHDVFEHGTGRKVYYINAGTVFALDGKPVFKIDHNYLIPLDGSRATLYFQETYVPAHLEGV
jgi:hypothetical protein